MADSTQTKRTSQLSTFVKYWWAKLIEPHQSVPQILPYERAKVLAILSLFLFAFALTLLFFADNLRGASIDIGLALIAGTAYGFSRSKRPFIGSLILIVCILILYFILWLSFPQFIVRSLIFVLLPILLSVLLLSALSALLACVAIFLSLCMLPFLTFISFADIGDTFFAIILTMVLAVVLAFLRENNVKQLTQQKKALDESNLVLEKRVEERTRKAEEAQLEAEAARTAISRVNHQLEEQIWIKTQQNELARIMRGDMDLQSLSDAVIRHLCQILEMPIGTLFIMSEGQLQYKSGYGFIRSAEHLTEFVVGEGLIGRVAQSKESMLITDVPDGYLPISLGTMMVAPHYVYIIPFLHEEFVMGVIEFGYMSPLSPKEIMFLEQAMEMIGTSFHAVYVQEQMKALLQAHFMEDV